MHAWSPRRARGSPLAGAGRIYGRAGIAGHLSVFPRKDGWHETPPVVPSFYVYRVQYWRDNGRIRGKLRVLLRDIENGQTLITKESNR